MRPYIWYGWDGWIIGASVLLLLGAMTNMAWALDLTHLARAVGHYHAWTLYAFHNESTGQYRLSRAATEDKKHDVTLTVDSGISVHTKQCTESMEVVFKRKEVNDENIDKEGIIELQLDKQTPSRLPGKIIGTTDERFVFFSFNSPFPTNYFLQGKTVSMHVKGVGRARFSLQGFDQAYPEAKKTCQQHATEQQPLSGSLPLTLPELTCRMLGVFVQNYAAKRDQGVPITDALMDLRDWVTQSGHPPAIQSLHEQLLRSVYQDTWLTPVRARQQFETKCVLQMHKEGH